MHDFYKMFNHSNKKIIIISTFYFGFIHQLWCWSTEPGLYRCQHCLLPVHRFVSTLRWFMIRLHRFHTFSRYLSCLFLFVYKISLLPSTSFSNINSSITCIKKLHKEPRNIKPVNIKLIAHKGMLYPPKALLLDKVTEYLFWVNLGSLTN